MAIYTKFVGDLKDYKFFVPAYQRGYRWTKDEVNDLLNDIDEFTTSDDKGYCLQPLIVKKRGEQYEVVDGQQRLTTIYIFMKIAEQEIRSATPPFKLEYETRINSAKFLQALSDDVLNSDADGNIDYFHIIHAYRTINDWLDEQKDKSVAIQELNTKIRKSVFFIWYEITDDVDPILTFKKVNVGKIPLTNAELVKALLLNNENFDVNSEKRQVEISLAWDRIEQGLHDNSFWYFLNEEERSGTRIDMLFELISLEINEEYEFIAQGRQQYFSFIVFFYYFKKRVTQSSKPEDIVQEIWDKVESLYSEFRYWYHDLEKYHLIGFLIVSEVLIKEIFAIMRNRRKSDMVSGLYKKVKQLVGNTDLEYLKEMYYDNTYRKKIIRKILLLFNIATLVCKSEKQYRFPFDIFKNDKWDIEHIHALGDKSDENDENEEKDHYLHNLALLDCTTNRSYKNAPFFEKRKIILEYESKGLFVPLCTKNVFLKVYTQQIEDMEKWGDNDKNDYIDAMHQVFSQFFKRGSYE